MKRHGWEEALVGRVREEKRREEKRRERVRRKSQKKQDQNARKVEKSVYVCVFPLFVAPGNGRVGSLKQRVLSHLERSEMKKCMPSWREARFEVNSVANLHSRTTFGSCKVEILHPIVVQTTFRSGTCLKSDGLGPLLGVQNVKKVNTTTNTTATTTSATRRHYNNNNNNN